MKTCRTHTIFLILLYPTSFVSMHPVWGLSSLFPQLVPLCHISDSLYAWLSLVWTVNLRKPKYVTGCEWIFGIIFCSGNSTLCFSLPLVSSSPSFPSFSSSSLLILFLSLPFPPPAPLPLPPPPSAAPPPSYPFLTVLIFIWHNSDVIELYRCNYTKVNTF